MRCFLHCSAFLFALILGLAPVQAQEKRRTAQRSDDPENFWAFKPAHLPEIPKVIDTAWPTCPLDHFVLARLEAKGLKPAARADARTLIRRATFDLTGLPPTPAEIDAFLADSSPQAFAKVVERLLASAAYGERWGRHWLDVVRYADSNGFDLNMPYPNSWRYRDYVIESFNQDKPYDRFLQEQLAGDLLAGDARPGDGAADSRSQRLIATGFLTLGPKAFTEVDRKKMELDVIDEQIDTLGRAFLGLTLGCARCHDHKFDPIGMDDYYGLVGIFQSTRVMEKNAGIHEATLPWPLDDPIKQGYDRAVSRKRDELAAALRRADRDVVMSALRLPGNFMKQAAAGFIQLDNGMPEADNIADFFSDCCAKLMPRSPLWQIWLAVAILLPAGMRLILWLRTRPGLIAKVIGWVRYVVPVGLAGIIAFELAHDLSAVWTYRQSITDAQQPKMFEVFYPYYDKKSLKELRESLARVEKTAPAVPRAMCVAEGKVADAPLCLRGSHLDLGKTVPRRVPKVIAGKAAPSFSAGESGRRELARWLVEPDHPLTSRVMVNRVWRWHFGHGIVRTPDNFGWLGERPDNPELLDWLARRFVASGWSIKALHRAIMLSSTYQMSSTPDAANAAQDPENRLLGRANMRRLDAEAIHDALLAAAGMLDRTMGGPPLDEKCRASFVDITADKTVATFESRRRAVYVPVIRNKVNDMFQLFDFPDPASICGHRPTTTFASQALFMLNSEWVAGLCENLADSLLARKDLSDAMRVGRVYLAAYGREPTKLETEQAIVLVGDVDRALSERVPDAEVRRRHAWTALCQVLVAANEFVYVK